MELQRLLHLYIPAFPGIVVRMISRSQPSTVAVGDPADTVKQTPVAGSPSSTVLLAESITTPTAKHKQTMSLWNNSHHSNSRAFYGGSFCEESISNIHYCCSTSYILVSPCLTTYHHHP